jgi:hypothetical protein
MSRQIELNIGKDLQFIRINGTLVGGTIGLGLWLLSQIPALLHLRVRKAANSGATRCAACSRCSFSDSRSASSRTSVSPNH